MTFEEFNKNKEEAGKLLFNCCGSVTWKDEMLKQHPFSTESSLLEYARDIWYNRCNEADWMEAFTHHPKIGDIKGSKEKFAETAEMASSEQAKVSESSTEVIKELAKSNREYEARFGFIFIICATGKSAGEMLRLLTDRLNNSLREELHIAMGEQSKITRLRMQKMLGVENDVTARSQITTHVLDTSTGIPGADITIRLKKITNGIWETFCQGITNADGRIPDLLPPGMMLEKGVYKLSFDTGSYFKKHNIKNFYPEVEIQFTTTDDKHYHVPLLINPFGFSTYRGS